MIGLRFLVAIEILAFFLVVSSSPFRQRVFSPEHSDPKNGGADPWKPTIGNRTREEHLAYNGRSKEEHEFVTAKMANIRNLSSVHRHGIPSAGSLSGPIGDVLLTREQVEELEEYLKNLTNTKSSRARRQLEVFSSNLANKWTSFPIIYTVDPIFEDPLFDYVSAIDTAVRMWTTQTCVTFSKVDPSTPVANQHILFTPGNGGCNSFIGRVPPSSSNVPPQTINLQSPDCFFLIGKIGHEIGHALGLYHTVERPDVGSYVDILWQNIASGQTFAYETSDTVLTAGTPYDYGSVMQYSATDFANRAGVDTLRPRDPTYRTTLGQSTEVSFYDAKLINLAYCDHVCPVKLNCQNGGYSDPKNCAICRCPDGFGGTLCTGIPRGSPGCKPQSGMISVDGSATISTPKCLQSPNFVENAGGYSQGDDCFWKLKAPMGCTLDVWFNSNWFGLLITGGCQHWIELKYKPSQTVRGERLCGYSPKYTVSSRLTSVGNTVGVTFKAPANGLMFSLPYFRGFQLCYAITNPSCLHG